MSNADAWMPLWIGDYLKDTTRLSLAEHGAYIKLLMDAWVNGPQADDNAELCRIVGCFPKEWRTIRPKIERLFKVADGVWRHKRLEDERAAAEERSDKARTKAQRAAAGRWHKEDKPGGSKQEGRERTPEAMLGALPEALPDAVHEQCPSPSPTTLPSEEPETLDGKAWREAVALLVMAGGMKDQAARSFFGGLLKSSGLEAHKLRPSILAASQNGTMDPRGYLSAAASRLAGKAVAAQPRTDVAGWSDDVWAVAVVNFRRDGTWDVATMGPRPGDDGCLVPTRVLDVREAA